MTLTAADNGVASSAVEAANGGTNWAPAAILIAAVISAAAIFLTFLLNHTRQLVELGVAQPRELAFRASDRTFEMSEAWLEKWAETDKQIALMRVEREWLWRNGPAEQEPNV